MKKLLVAFACLLVLASPAFGQKTKTQLNTEINTNFPDNTTGAITPSILRATTTDFVASWVDYLLCGASGGIVYWSTAAPPAPTCLPKGTDGQFLTLSSGLPSWATFASSWPSGGGPGTGTQGGIPYFNSTTTTLSSLLLTLYKPIVGGGASAAPSSGAVTNTGVGPYTFATSTGTLNVGNCTQIGANHDFVDAGIVCGGTSASTIIPPQGRLTLQSGVPVMTTNQINKSTVFYDCYKGGSQVPYNTGGADLLDTIGKQDGAGQACEVSATMPGLTTANLFDVFWAHGGTNHVCVAADVSGNGWPSSTARSGIAVLDTTTKPYITNGATISFCYGTVASVSTNYCATPCVANRLTYLGTIYTTAAGQTGMNYRPAAVSGGGANILGLFNAYNPVETEAYNWDNGGGATWSIASTTFRHINNNANNTITYVDGLGTSSAFCDYFVGAGAVSGNQYLTGCEINWVSGAPRTIQFGAIGVSGGARATQSLPPTLGLNVVSPLEATYTGAAITVYPTCVQWLCTTNTAQIEQLMVRLGGI